MDLVSEVEDSIARHQLLEAGERVLVGVSGGVDSVVLAEVLRRIGKFELVVGHFNHCLRGAESDADEEFVKELARGWKVEFVSGRGDVKEYAEKNGVSIEMAARDLRYEFLVETARRMGIGKIALGHHEDDQVETIWMGMLRGVLGGGAAGMDWKRKVQARARTEVWAVRPLLGVRKQELLDFARKEGIEYREDSTNASPDFLRNRVRLELLKMLEDMQPEVRKLTLRRAEVFGAEKCFLERMARDWLAGQRCEEGEQFEDLDEALQREVVRVQLEDMGVNPNYDLIELLRANGNVPVAIAKQRRLQRGRAGEITVVGQKPTLEFLTEKVRVALGDGGRVKFGEVEFQWEVVKERGAVKEGVEFYDAEKVGGTVTVRYWTLGDRFQPIGLKGEAKLQDLFTNLKVSAAEKRQRMVAVDAKGKIFWVEGLRISEGHKVSEGTTRVLSWSWRRNR